MFPQTQSMIAFQIGIPSMLESKRPPLSSTNGTILTRKTDSSGDMNLPIVDINQVIKLSILFLRIPIVTHGISTVNRIFH